MSCVIVAELSGNHGGDYDTAIQLINVAKDCGADMVKIQTYYPDSMPDRKDVIKGCGPKWDGKLWQEAYEATYMPWGLQPKLKKYADSIKIPLFTTVCSAIAVNYMEARSDMLMYKVAEWQNQDTLLVKAIQDTGKPLVLSTRGLAYHLPIREQDTLLAKDSLPLIHRLLNNYGYHQVGYSNHRSPDYCVKAVRYGARMVEQHLCLTRDAIDGQFAATPEQFKEMVQQIRRVECELST